MTTNTNTNPSSNGYPFTSRKDMKASLDSSFEVRSQAMVTLFTNQTAHEQDTKSTVVKNRVGFMSSHAVKGSAVALKLIAGEALTDDDVDTINKIAPRYSRQLAVLARNVALASDPTLADQAALFGIK